jgi:hypothetical protein
VEWLPAAPEGGVVKERRGYTWSRSFLSGCSRAHALSYPVYSDV